MRLLYKIITGLLVALGFLHIAFTPLTYKEFDMDAVWFVSAGVAIILAGFLNVAVIRVGNDIVHALRSYEYNVRCAVRHGVVSDGSTASFYRS
jgi:hypothetical protein